MTEEPEVDGSVSHLLDRKDTVREGLSACGECSAFIWMEGQHFAMPQQRELSTVRAQKPGQRRLEYLKVTVDLCVDCASLHGISPATPYHSASALRFPSSHVVSS